MDMSVSYTHLDVYKRQACLRLILEDTIAYLAKKKSVTDPMTQKTFDYYKENK